jgi:hypothetical protein
VHVLLVLIVLLVLLVLCGGMLADENGWKVLFRAWVVLSAIWVGLFWIIIGRDPQTDTNLVFGAMAGPPAALFALGIAVRWIFGGFATR